MEYYSKDPVNFFHSMNLVEDQVLVKVSERIQLIAEEITNDIT